MKEAGQGHLAYVDGLRAVAVLAVVVCHCGAATFGQAAGWRVCGARGVDLFFIISGFCLAYPNLARRKSGAGPGTVDFVPFLRRRFVRLAPSYYGAIALFAVLGMTGFGLPTSSAVHAPGTIAQLREVFSDVTFTPSTQSLYDATFWTLGLEFQWYLVFPVLLGLYVRSRVAFGLVGAIFYILYMNTHLVPPVVGTLPCFMLGIVAADARLSGLRVPTVAGVPVIALMLLAARAQLAHPEDVDHGDPLWHAAAFTFVLVVGCSSLAQTLALRPLTFVGLRSYSIYLVHAPFLTFLGRAGVAWSLAGVCSVGVGVIYWQIVERRLTRPGIRARLEALPRDVDRFLLAAFGRLALRRNG